MRAIYNSLLTLCCCLLLGLTPLSIRAETAATGDPLVRAQALLDALTPTTDTAQFATTARSFGALVDEVRQQGAPDEVLIKLRKLASNMRKQTEERLRAAEAAAGEDEGALEQVYRSQVWEDLSFSLVAFPFWGSWLDLTLADRPARAADRAQLIWRARRGFRAASMQIYQPSLVYGGWLGLGFAAVAEKKPAQAREIFNSLIKSLSFDAQHPVRKAAEAELAVLAKGPQAAPAPDQQPVEGASVPNPVRDELFALLEQHRKTKVGAREAGARIRQLLADDRVSMALIVDLMQYRAEIVSEDTGWLTPLFAAEFALGNQQWITAAQKYREFFAKRRDNRQLNFNRFRYRYAVACLKADLNDDAAEIADDLLDAPRLEAELERAAAKLAYVARAKRPDAKSTGGSRAELKAAAQRFIKLNPADPDALGARITLAQSAGDTAGALKLLSQIKSPAGAAGSVETSRFYVIAREFAKQANRPGAQLDALARDGLKVWAALPEEQRKNKQNLVFSLQLRAVADSDPAAVLKAIALAEQQPGVSVNDQRVYFWSRLRLYDRQNAPRLALGQVEAAGAVVPAWMAEQLYPWVKQLKDTALQAEFAAALAPKLKALPEMERRFRLLHIELLLADGQGEAAYTASRALVADYPKTGDGYRMLARSAQQTKRLIEADNAWAIITKKVPPSFPIWWDGMLSRIEIRAGSTRPESACELAVKVARQKAPDAGTEKRWQAARSRLKCATES